MPRRINQPCLAARVPGTRAVRPCTAGKNVDASIVESTNKPRKKSRDDESEQTVEETKPHRERQIDSDARSTMKRKRWYFGYKNHIKLDADKGHAGVGPKVEVIAVEALPRIMRKGKQNKPGTAEQKAENEQWPKIRSRVEHAFGDQHIGMRLTKISTRLKARAEFTIRLNNLAYNLRRLGFLLPQPGFATK